MAIRGLGKEQQGMSKILLSILFICIGVGIFVVYTKNNTGVNIINNQQSSVSHAPVDGKLMKQKTFSNVDKQQVKQPSNSVLTAAKTDFRPIQDQDEKLKSIQDKLAELTEAETPQESTDSEPIALWEKDSSEDFGEDTTIEHEERIKTNPEVLAKLQVGQVLDFFIPQLGESFQSEVTSTSNQLGNVKVWKGNIQNEEQEKSNFIMTQGAVNTNVVLSTAQGVYTVYIDNETGEGTVIDDREYTSRMSDTDDSVPYPHEQILN